MCSVLDLSFLTYITTHYGTCHITALSIMSTSPKIEIPSSDFEEDSHGVSLESRFRIFHIVDNARLALTILALAAGITILGVSADSIAVYDATHVADDFLLPLWPANFNLHPTVALVAGSAIVVLANAVSIVASKTQTVSLPLPRIRHHFVHID